MDQPTHMLPWLRRQRRWPVPQRGNAAKCAHRSRDSDRAATPGKPECCRTPDGMPTPDIATPDGTATHRGAAATPDVEDPMRKAQGPARRTTAAAWCDRRAGGSRLWISVLG